MKRYLVPLLLVATACSGSQTLQETPTSDETVGAWSAATFAKPFRISMEPGSYPVWVAGGATHQNLDGAWDGGRFARITPPTSPQTYGGIGAFDLPASRSVSLRWEMRTGPTFASGGQDFVDRGALPGTTMFLGRLLAYRHESRPLPLLALSILITNTVYR